MFANPSVRFSIAHIAHLFPECLDIVFDADAQDYFCALQVGFDPSLKMRIDVFAKPIALQRFDCQKKTNVTLPHRWMVFVQVDKPNGSVVLVNQQRNLFIRFDMLARAVR